MRRAGRRTVSADHTDELPLRLRRCACIPVINLIQPLPARVFPALDSQNALRVTTGMLNELLARATARVQPPSDNGRRLKIYYMTQISTRPPTFVCFVNRKDLFHFSYQRYIENQIRETFGLEGTPVRMVVRERGDGSTK